MLYVLLSQLPASHAHDSSQAYLVAPLPEALNFVAYHRVHHISPGCNFGLMLLTDVFYDWLLGVKTVQSPASLAAKTE